MTCSWNHSNGLDRYSLIISHHIVHKSEHYGGVDEIHPKNRYILQIIQVHNYQPTVNATSAFHRLPVRHCIV